MDDDLHSVHAVWNGVWLETLNDNVIMGPYIEIWLNGSAGLEAVVFGCIFGVLAWDQTGTIPPPFPSVPATPMPKDWAYSGFQFRYGELWGVADESRS